MDNWIGRLVLPFFFFFSLCLLIAYSNSWCLFSILLMFNSHDFWVTLCVASSVFEVYALFSVAGREGIAWRYLHGSMEQDTFFKKLISEIYMTLSFLCCLDDIRRL